MNEYMKVAIEEARAGINNNEGGPFGCAIVKNGKIVGRGHNQVVLKNDPTCHGEMQAIRQACSELNTFDLSDCTLYTTGEPCHMCLSAIMWARVKKVYYGCTIEDNSKIGFRDGFMNEIFGGREKLGNFLEMTNREECLELFEDYNNIKDKTNY